jgi:SAM-dependent methyltransferase
MCNETPIFEPSDPPLFADIALFPREPVRTLDRTLDPYGCGLPVEDAFAVRKRLAHQYLRGRGVEFGALHSALDVPLEVEVRYADWQPVERLQRSFPHIINIRTPDLITDLESMNGIDDESEDFVIANHVMEHVEDPFRALKSMNRVLRPNGIAFVALPDKRFTFDKDRKITSLDHLIRDNEQGPDWSLAEHYDEWCRCVDGLSGDAHAAKVADMLAQRANIHFHVWDYPAMMEMFAYAARLPDLRLEILLSMLNTIEVVWLLRKVP